MFGHDHEDKKDDDNNQPISTQPVNHGLLGIDDDDTASASPIPEPSSAPVPGTPEPPAPSLPVTPDPTPITQPEDATTTVESTVKDEAPTTDTANEATPPSVSIADSTTEETPTDPLPAPSPALSDDLVDIKRQALQELSPLIDHLDQDSEEKFKTTMMMIQASDDQDLIPQAFKVAKEIPDEKRRAQALLDIVNEINYFTHKTEE